MPRRCNPLPFEAIFGGMQNVKELVRHEAPGARPQPLALLGGKLWVGSWGTGSLYALDPESWKVVDEVQAPGTPFGLAAVGNELRAVIALGEEDDRYLFRFVPGQGFDPESKTPCPDFTGSHLAYDGKTLYMAQMGLRRIVELDEKSAIVREIPLPTRIGGMGFGPDAFYLIAADEEFEDLKMATFDISQERPEVAPLAQIPFDARALTWDGSGWWTCHREESQIVRFTI